HPNVWGVRSFRYQKLNTFFYKLTYFYYFRRTSALLFTKPAFFFMKITHTEIYRLSIRMEPFAIATGTMDYAQNVFIRIHTDEGMYGVGECSAFPMIVGEIQDTCLVLARDFARLWKSKDPLAVADRLAELDDYIAGNTTVKSAFDIALHDLAAKFSGVPLYRHLGGAPRPITTDI